VRVASNPAHVSTPLRCTAGVGGLAVAVAVAFFFDLGRPHLWDPGEGRYAEAVREMLVTGNWIAPTLNFAPYYDKPPGFYWLVAAAFQLLGMTEWTARLPAAIAAALTIAATVAFAWRRVAPAAALGAGAILATTVQFVILGRSVRMDTLLTLGLGCTLYYAYALWAEPDPAAAPRTKPPSTWPLYVLPALGMLVKGPVAVIIPVLVIAAMTLVTGRWGRLRRFRPGMGVLVALAIAGAWYAVAAVYAPDYLWTFLWQHNLTRFVGGRSGHPEPFWYFFWVLPVTFLPWTLFLPSALRSSVERVRRGDDLHLFLCSWFAVVFVFFTFSRTKLATYMLPAFPPLALLVSTYLARVLDAPEPDRMRAFRVPAILWAAGMTVALVGTVIGVTLRQPAHAGQAAVALVLLIFPLGGWLTIRQQSWRVVPLLILVATLTSQVFFYRAGSASVDDFSSLHAAAVAARDLPAAAPVFAYKTHGYSFTFYDGRTVKGLSSPQAAATILASAAPTGLLTKERYLDRIQRHLTEPVYVWWEGGSGRVLIANRLPPQPAENRVPRSLAPTGTARSAERAISATEDRKTDAGPAS